MRHVTKQAKARKPAFRHPVDSHREKLRRQTGAAMKWHVLIMATTSPEAEGNHGRRRMGESKAVIINIESTARSSRLHPRAILCSWAVRLQLTRSGAVTSQGDAPGLERKARASRG